LRNIDERADSWLGLRQLQYDININNDDDKNNYLDNYNYGTILLFWDWTIISENQYNLIYNVFDLFV
jgi:hypothetical protein